MVYRSFRCMRGDSSGFHVQLLNSNTKGRSNRHVSILHAALIVSPAPKLRSVLTMACAFVCVVVQIEHLNLDCGTINQQLVVFLPLTIEKPRR